MKRASRQFATAVGPLVLGAALLFHAAAVRAEGPSLHIQPAFSAAESNVIDETGRATHARTNQTGQKYRLTLDRTLFPLVTFNAGGSLDWLLGSSRADGLLTEFDSKRWGGFARLNAGGPFLSGGLGYSRSQPGGDAALVRENVSGSVGWRPSELPSLDLRVSRTNSFDLARRSLDISADEASLASAYRPAKQVDLRYSARYASPNNRLKQVQSSDLINSLSATWSDRFFDGRASTYLSYIVSTRSTQVTTFGGGGTVLTQQLPTGGLSIVEAFPAVPASVTLNPNSALVDGTTSVSAGLNVGYSATLGGDTAFRDLGAQLGDAITPVNQIHVWVDRQLPAVIVSAFSWTAFRSDDNLTWDPVALTGRAGFDPVQNRFEIPVEQTQARYLKVVTRPLDAAVTTDPQFAEIFVTEVQLFLAVPAEQARRQSFLAGGTLSGSTRVLLFRKAALAYDLSASLNHSSDRGYLTYSAVNGLSMARPIASAVNISARLDRTDFDLGRGHEALNRWGVGLALELSPSWGAAATYGGQLGQRPAGTTLTNSLNLTGRADLYRGVALNANATLSRALGESGRETQAFSMAASTSLVPHRALSINATISYAESMTVGGPTLGLADRRGVIDGSASFSPFPAFAVAGGLTRFFIGYRPATLANFTGTLSPLQGGNLSIRYGYTETLDTSADQRTRSHGPSLRWNIRQGWLFDASYAFLDSTTPAQTSNTRALSLNLLIALR